MKKSIFFVLLIFVIFFYHCNKQEQAENTYADICKKVVECDKSLVQFQDLDKQCHIFFQKLEKERSPSLASIVECIKTTPCEILSFQSCTVEYIKELQSMQPGLK